MNNSYDNLTLEQLYEINMEVKEAIFIQLEQEINLDVNGVNFFNADNKFICHYCASIKTNKYGRNEQNKQKYKCNDCGKIMIANRDTLTFSTKKEFKQWATFIESLLNKDSIKINAEKAGVSLRTAFRWRIKVLNVLCKLMNNTVLEGVVHLDETLVNKSFKNRNINFNPIKKRGMSNDKVNITCAIDSSNNVIIKVSDFGRIKANTLIEIYTGMIKENSIVVSDSLRSYHKLMSKLNIDWKKIPSKKKSIDNYTLDPINHLHALIKDFLYHYKGISIKYLQGYLALFNFMYKQPKHRSNSIFKGVLSKIMCSLGHIKCKDIDNGAISLAT